MKIPLFDKARWMLRWILWRERALHSLNIPFVSQLGNVKRNDCGPACVAMILNTGDILYSIENVYTLTGISGDNYWSTWNLIKALDIFGIESRRWVAPDIEACIKNRFGFIALVNYAHFQDWEQNPNSGFRHNHFVVVAGFDRNNILVLDPLYPNDKRRWVPKDVFYKAWETAEDANRLAVVTVEAIE